MEKWVGVLVGRRVVLPALVAALCALAWLQYRWSVEASEGAQERMRQRMAQTAQRIKHDLVRDLLEACRMLEVNAAGTDEAVGAAVSAQLRKADGDVFSGALVNAVYLAFPGGESGFRVERVRRAGAPSLRAKPSYWPRVEKELKLNMEARRAEAGRWKWPCMFDGDILVLQRALNAEPAAGAAGSGGEPLAYVLIEFDEAHLRRRRLPKLVDRHLPDPSPRYRVAILRGEGEGEVLYSNADGVDGQDAGLAVEAIGGSGGPGDGLRVPAAQGSRGWSVVVQHPEGSLDAIGRRLKLRNRAVASGVLLLLAATTVLLVYSAERARQLARMQMSLAAGMSHELRTPVTAVCMIADNLAKGVADTPEHARRYGHLLQQQGLRLAALVDDILQFADFQRRPAGYEAGAVEVESAIFEALEAERPMIEDAGVRVDTQIAAGLPAVRAHGPALVRCLDNLLSNALKHGAAGGHIGIHAQRAPSLDGEEVKITVEDRGPGIPAADQPFLFQPFFRGSWGRGAQTPGSGLGLTLVKQMVEEMGGRVSFESRAGAGSAFTLHLHAAGNGKGKA